MANFGEEIRLSLECYVKFYRLPVVSSATTFYINTGRNSVSAIQSQDQKLLQTWTLTHPHSFSSPVVFCDVDDMLYCAVDGKTLMFWPSTAYDLKEATKVKFQSAIFSVISLPSVGCFAVFTSGDVFEVEHIISHPDTAPPSCAKPAIRNEVIWADVAIDNEGDIIASILTYVEKEKNHILSNHILRKGESSFVPFNTHSISKSDKSLKTWSSNKLSTPPTFLAVWSDGEIEAYSLRDQKSELLFTLPTVHHGLCMAIDMINRSHLAVAKFEASSSKKLAIVEIWDVKYAVRKAVKEIKYPPSKHFQITAVNSSVFISTCEGIVLLPLHIGSSTLSAVVGRSILTDCETTYSWTADGSLCENEVPMSCENDIHSLKMLCSNFSAEQFEEVVLTLHEDKMSQFCCYLSELKNVSEKELVKMLEIVLKKSEGTFSSSSSKTDRLICSIFKIPYSDVFLRPHLTRLSFHNTVKALQFLLQLFHSDIFSVEDTTRPSDVQIVNWAQLLLQAHFDEFVLSTSEDVVKLLKELRSTLQFKIEIYSELEEIWHLIKIQQKKNILPEQDVKTKYCIETLYL